MLPDLMMHNSYYFTFSHIYYYCEKRKNRSFKSLSKFKGGISMTNKKLTKKVCKFEKKHPNLTAACVYVTAGTFAFRVVSTIVGGAIAAKTIKEVRNGNEVINEDEEDK